jgi:hypothetical protein
MDIIIHSYMILIKIAGGGNFIFYFDKISKCYEIDLTIKMYQKKLKILFLALHLVDLIKI